MPSVRASFTVGNLAHLFELSIIGAATVGEAAVALFPMSSCSCAAIPFRNVEDAGATSWWTVLAPAAGTDAFFLFTFSFLSVLRSERAELPLLFKNFFRPRSFDLTLDAFFELEVESPFFDSADDAAAAAAAFSVAVRPVNRRASFLPRSIA